MHGIEGVGSSVVKCKCIHCPHDGHVREAYLDAKGVGPASGFKDYVIQGLWLWF